MTFKPVTTKRAISGGYFAELRLAYGPRALGVTGGGEFLDLYGFAWLGLLDRTRGGAFSLYQATNPDGTPWSITDPTDGVTWGLIVEPGLDIPKNARHISLAFDQSARPVVAYESAGEVWVRQWDPTSGQYVMRGPWPGVDPVIINDATVNWRIPESDVLVFHLDTTRTTVIMRAQRELYHTEHVVYTNAEEVCLDQVIDLPLRFEVVGSTESDPTRTNVVLQSELYPLHLPLEQLEAIGLHANSSATYTPMVVVLGLPDESLGAAAVAMQPSATYVPLVIVQSLGIDGIGAAIAAQPSALYKAVVISIDLVASPYSLDQSNATLDALGSGTYKLVVIVHDLVGAGYTVDGVGAASLRTQGGASYVAA